MSLSEFKLIEKYFNVKNKAAFPAALTIGDDCAVVDIPEGQQLAVTSDTLVEGVHFLAGSDPALLGHKVLAVNLSDLAAMGATPAWLTLAITLPKVDEAWLEGFSRGFLNLAAEYDTQLIGGDTTQGPLSITVTAFGLLPKGSALKRSTAKVDDNVFVSGVIGSAGLGLLLAQQDNIVADNEDLLHYLKPMPCVEIGLQIRELASSCIDISDGLAADLNHILQASGVGATLNNELLPMTAGVQQHIQQQADWRWPYSTGDDYQLCFTCPEDQEIELLTILKGHRITKIGKVEKELGLRIRFKDGQQEVLTKGYQHF